MTLALAALLACRPEPPGGGAPRALWFGGDVHLGAEPRATLSGITELVGDAVGVVNLEGPIVAGPGHARLTPAGVLLANPDSTARFLRGNRIVAASVANNHAADQGGAGGIRMTTARLRAGGVAPLGSVAGPGRLLLGDQIVVLFAHDLGEEDVPAAVRRELLGKGDSTGAVVVESFHVTGPPSYLPTPDLVAAVEAAVLAGVDIVVAHGTHVVGPVERRGGTVIAWGLGNLLFDCTCTEDDEGLVLKVSLEAGHPAEVFPVRAGLGGAGATAAPDPDAILDLVDALGGTRLVREGEGGRF